MPEPDQVAVELRKIANLLALQQVDDLTKTGAVRVLDCAGFSTREMATLLGTTEGSIRALLSQGRKRASAAD